ncbi:hypothetical protein Taro_000802 [Colocasia esculenta]|uniref:Uncharacterized protein n=1 Tax=Colocasia esculenta TaxID=4460 RepID=A0A843TG52_COLES|nr:hypothetical protein [Colocasia esculenta]
MSCNFSGISVLRSTSPSGQVDTRSRSQNNCFQNRDSRSTHSQSRYKHFYAKDVSTHPSMVSTQQHRFKGKMCKNVETVSTGVKSVSTRVAIFQESVYSGRPHHQGRSTLDLAPRTAVFRTGTAGRHTHRAGRHGTFFPEQHFPYFGQCVDTTTRAGRHTTKRFHLKKPLKHPKEADQVEAIVGEEFKEGPTSQIAEHRLGLQVCKLLPNPSFYKGVHLKNEVRLHSSSLRGGLRRREHIKEDRGALILWPAEEGEVGVSQSTAVRGYCTVVITTPPWAQTIQSTGESTKSTDNPFIANEGAATFVSLRRTPQSPGYGPRIVHSSFLAITVGPALLPRFQSSPRLCC